MDKNEIKKLLPTAIKVTEATKGVDDKTRNKMSAFGATVIMSGLLPAVAAYSKDEKKIVVDILKAMCVEDKVNIGDEKLFNYIKKNDNEDTKDRIINYVIAVKLALDAIA